VQAGLFGQHLLGGLGEAAGQHAGLAGHLLSGRRQLARAQPGLLVEGEVAFAASAAVVVSAGQVERAEQTEDAVFGPVAVEVSRLPAPRAGYR
jgi:hypothetical protein